MDKETDDTEKHLELHRRNTWQCSKCGGRHPLMCNYCPDAKGAAINAGDSSSQVTKP